jgi:uncharacterized Ntn-hydrolase superfamily protein
MTTFINPPTPAWKATFSIVAADPSTGQVGVAVQSKYFAVGTVVPWVRSGIGAVATQALGVARYGPEILDALEKGTRPPEALKTALSDDPQVEQRQLGVIHADGEAANHTGAECMDWAGGRMGPNFTVQGNILAGKEVVDNMASAFLTTSGSLAERLISSLEAGQAAGGDSRGQQSAAILVDQVGYSDISMEGIDRLVDLRVDDHETPIAELRRLFGLWQHQDMIEKGMGFYSKGNFAAAVEIMAKANDQFPDSANILYNLACFESLAGNASESIIHLQQSITLDASFHELSKKDSDFDPVRDTTDFKALISTQ